VSKEQKQTKYNAKCQAINGENKLDIESEREKE
jgi:hypothetical protein